MKCFPYNVNPEIYTLTAIIVGLVLEDDYSASELNAIGNWLILVGQITITTAAQKQLINNRNNLYTNHLNNNRDSQKFLNKIYELEKEIEELKKR